MADPSSKSSSSTHNSKTSYRVTRTIFLDDIASNFSARKIISSEKFFCRHDPRPIIFLVKIEFGANEENYMSAFLYSVSHDAVLTYSKYLAYDDQGILVENIKGGRRVLKKGKGLGVRKLLSLERATTCPSWRIIFEFEYEATSAGTSKLAPSLSSELRLQNDFRQLLTSEEDADVVFLVAGKKIKAHKIILTTRCKYFKTMFNSGMAESVSKEVVVTDVNAAVFEQLLNFVYTDVTPEWGKGLNSDTAMKLLAAADKYGVGDLKNYCESTLCSQLNVDNVIQALLLAETHNCPSLMATAMSVFGSYVDVLKTQDDWDGLKKSPSLLLKLLEHCHV